MNEKPASKQIDEIIHQYDGWKANTLKEIQCIVTGTDPAIAEEVKWRTSNRPAGLPVWVYKEINCFAEIWKDNIKLVFFKSAQLAKPSGLFNARLESSTLRAVELREGDTPGEAGIGVIFRELREL